MSGEQRWDRVWLNARESGAGQDRQRKKEEEEEEEGGGEDEVDERCHGGKRS
jgi:hypothetical protein